MRQFIQIFNFKYIHVVINEPVSIKGPITQKGTFKFTLIEKVKVVWTWIFGFYIWKLGEYIHKTDGAVGDHPA